MCGVGDNRSGAGDGDDESVSINIPAVSEEVQSIFFIVANYSGNLSAAKSCHVRLVDAAGEPEYELARHDMDMNTEENALMVATLARMQNRLGARVVRLFTT